MLITHTRATQPDQLVGYSNKSDRLSKISTITQQNRFQNVKDLLDICVSTSLLTNQRRAFECVRFESRTRVGQAYVILLMCGSHVTFNFGFAVVVFEFGLYFLGYTTLMCSWYNGNVMSFTLSYISTISWSMDIWVESFAGSMKFGCFFCMCALILLFRCDIVMAAVVYDLNVSCILVYDDVFKI